MVEPFQRSLSKQVFCARYSVVRLLGAGAYGKVFLAKQNALNRLVAIKFFAPRERCDPVEDAERFLRETRLLAGLSHPNVLPVFDANLVCKSRFLVTEYLDGGDLAGRLVPDQPLEVAEALRVCAPVAEALRYLHEQGVIHRDLKPENVLLGSNGAVKVSDFGLARLSGDDHRLTAQGSALGTPAYMAPETFAAAETSAACDVYALGILLYFCFDGRYPFSKKLGLHELMQQKLDEGFPHPRPCVPPPLVPIMTACLKRNPALRPTACEVGDLLTRLANPPTAGFELPATPRRSATQKLATAPAQQQGAAPAIRWKTTGPAVSKRSGWKAAAWLAVAGLVVLLTFRAERLEPARVDSRPSLPHSPPPVLPGPAPGLHPSTRSPVRVDEAFLIKLYRAIRPFEIDWKIHSGFFDMGAIRNSVERPEVLAMARELVAAGGKIPTEVVPEPMLVKAIMSLQSLRLAAGKYRAHGLELPREYEAIAAAAFPLLKELPPDARRVLDVNHGVPWPAQLELSTLLGMGLEERPLAIPPALLRQLRARGSHRVWWVALVRGLDLTCVMDLHLFTAGREVRFPFIASERPLTGHSKPYSGVLSLGFDSRVLHRVTAPLQLSFKSLRSSDVRAPVVERLELWE